MTASANARPGPRTRVATAADIPSMIRVVNAAFEIEIFIEGTRTDTQRMSAMMEKGQFLLAEEDDGRMVACVYTQTRDERAYFGMLAVEPSRQGTGLGRLMVEAAENHCRERRCTWMDISVLSLRLELLPFYRKLGYVETSTEEFRPDRPLKSGFECHAIIMSKRL